VVGEEAQLTEVASRHQRGGCVVGEDSQRLQAVGRRHETVGGVVDPDDPEQRTLAVLQRDDQPVAVPRPRPAAVELRRVDVDVPLEPGPRLLVGEDVAAFPQKDLVEQRLDLSDAHGLALAHLPESPPRGRLRHECARLRVDERGADVAEVEGVPDARADPA
jgi:hypothetical protein